MTSRDQLPIVGACWDIFNLTDRQQTLDDSSEHAMFRI